MKSEEQGALLKEQTGKCGETLWNLLQPRQNPRSTGGAEKLRTDVQTLPG